MVSRFPERFLREEDLFKHDGRRRVNALRCKWNRPLDVAFCDKFSAEISLYACTSKSDAFRIETGENKNRFVSVDSEIKYSITFIRINFENISEDIYGEDFLIQYLPRL